MKPKCNLLFAPAGELPEGGGTATAPAADTAATAEKPGVIAMAIAGLKSKATLNSEIAQLKSDHDQAQARIVALEAERDRLAAENARHEQDAAELQKAMEGLAAETKEADVKAAEKLAAHGVPAQSLPAAEAEAETAETVRQKLAAEKDPAERFRLQERLEKLS